METVFNKMFPAWKTRELAGPGHSHQLSLLCSSPHLFAIFSSCTDVFTQGMFWRSSKGQVINLLLSLSFSCRCLHFCRHLLLLFTSAEGSFARNSWRSRRLAYSLCYLLNLRRVQYLLWVPLLEACLSIWAQTLARSLCCKEMVRQLLRQQEFLGLELKPEKDVYRKTDNTAKQACGRKQCQQLSFGEHYTFSLWPKHQKLGEGKQGTSSQNKCPPVYQEMVVRGDL